MNQIRILGDWGSTRLRLHRFVAGELVERTDGPGIIGLTQSPQDVLAELLGAWDVSPSQHVTLCGMAGARGGLREVPYAPCPASADEWAALAQDFPLANYRIRVAAGAACERSQGLRDLMRGEETQIFGAIQGDSALSRGTHLMVLPGTHSKWAVIENARITEFRTFLTGELYARLKGSSLLPGGDPEADAGNDDGFAAGVAASADNAGLLGNLFLTRSAQVDAGRAPDWAQGFLSGLLVGSECRAGLSAMANMAGPVHIIGGAELARRYLTAFEFLGVAAHALDADACTVSGLRIIDARS